MPSSESFLTGSMVYGTPHADSDIDLCIFVSEELRTKLFELSEEKGSGHSVMFGKLNLIPLSCPIIFQGWKEGTEECIKRRPVTRDDAVSTIKGHIKRLRKESNATE